MRLSQEEHERTIKETPHLHRPDLLILAARKTSYRLARAYGVPYREVEEIEGETIVLVMEALAKGIWFTKEVLRFAALTALKRVTSRRIISRAVAAESRETTPVEHEYTALWQLQKAWPTMSGRQRSALLLHLQGYELHEIGERLGSVGTVAARANLANQHVRAAVAKVRDGRLTHCSARRCPPRFA